MASRESWQVTFELQEYYLPLFNKGRNNFYRGVDLFDSMRSLKKEGRVKETKYGFFSVARPKVAEGWPRL